VLTHQNLSYVVGSGAMDSATAQACATNGVLATTGEADIGDFPDRASKYTPA